MKKITLIAATLLCCVAAPSFAQTPGEKMLESYHATEALMLMDAVNVQLAKMNDNKDDAAKNMIQLEGKQAQLKDALARGAKYQDFSLGILAEIVSDTKLIPIGASAPQITQLNSEQSLKAQILIGAQNAAIIEQNKQIIELLQKIADKK